MQSLSASFDYDGEPIGYLLVCCVITGQKIDFKKLEKKTENFEKYFRCENVIREELLIFRLYINQVTKIS